MYTVAVLCVGEWCEYILIGSKHNISSGTTIDYVISQNIEHKAGVLPLIRRNMDYMDYIVILSMTLPWTQNIFEQFVK